MPHQTNYSVTRLTVNIGPPSHILRNSLPGYQLPTINPMTTGNDQISMSLPPSRDSYSSSMTSRLVSGSSTGATSPGSAGFQNPSPSCSECQKKERENSNLAQENSNLTPEISNLTQEISNQTQEISNLRYRLDVSLGSDNGPSMWT